MPDTKGRGNRVNGTNPGPIESCTMTAVERRPSPDAAALHAGIADAIPMKSHRTAAEAAGVAGILASADAG